MPWYPNAFYKIEKFLSSSQLLNKDWGKLGIIWDIMNYC